LLVEQPPPAAQGQKVVAFKSSLMRRTGSPARASRVRTSTSISSCSRSGRSCFRSEESASSCNTWWKEVRPA
jgi:hypothetical protein